MVSVWEFTEGVKGLTVTVHGLRRTPDVNLQENPRCKPHYEGTCQQYGFNISAIM